METFVAGYLLVWGAVVVYLARLERRQRGLQQTLEALRSQLGTEEENPVAAPRARRAA